MSAHPPGGAGPALANPGGARRFQTPGGMGRPFLPAQLLSPLFRGGKGVLSAFCIVATFFFFLPEIIFFCLFVLHLLGSNERIINVLLGCCPVAMPGLFLKDGVSK